MNRGGLVFIVLAVSLCLSVGIVQAPPPDGTGEFKVSNYGSGESTGNFWYRGYRFQVSVQTNVTHLMGSVTGGTFHIGLYNMTIDGGAGPEENIVPHTLLGSVALVGAGEEQVLELDTPVILEPDTDYILAQGRESGSGEHMYVTSLEIADLLAGSPRINFWEPETDNSIRWSNEGDASHIVGLNSNDYHGAMPKLGFWYVSDVSFPVVTTLPAEGNNTDEVILRGYLNSTGDGNTTVYIEWGEESDLSDGTLQQRGIFDQNNVSFSYSISYDNETTLYYRAVGINDAGRTNGVILQPVFDENFSYSNLSVSPSTIVLGQSVNVSFTINNTGFSPGTYNADLYVNGVFAQPIIGTVDSGLSHIVSEFTPLASGHVNISLEGLSEEIIVSAFPLMEDFSGVEPSNWVTVGDASWNVVHDGESTLELTPNSGNQAGLGFYDQSFSSSQGILAEFEYYAAEGTGADGIAFFLVDGDAVDNSSITPGQSGGALGYGSGDSDGIPHAYLGVGFDEFGNFVSSGGDSECLGSTTSQTVAIRGSGHEQTGYDCLTYAQVIPISGLNIDGGWRTARVSVLPDQDNTTLVVEMSWDGGDNWFTIIDNYVYEVQPPKNLKLGFSGSTGGSTNVHAIGSLNVFLPADLVVEIIENPLGNFSRGDTVSYSFNVTNLGLNDAPAVIINNSITTDSFSSLHWNVSAPGQLQSGDATNVSTIVVSLSQGETAVVQVEAVVGQNTWVDQNHSVSAFPGEGLSDPSPSLARKNVVLAVQSNPVIQFVSPTPNDSAVITQDAFVVNVTLEEAFMRNMTYSWNGDRFAVYDERLILMYDFDNISSSNATDVHDGGVSENHGVCQGMNDTCSYVNGVRETAMYFNGSSYVQTPYNPAYQVGDAFTYSLWFKTNITQNNVGLFSARDNGKANNPLAEVYMRTDSVDGLFRGATGSRMDLVHEVTYAGNAWHHVVIVIDNGTGSMYFNGNLVANASGLDMDIDLSDVFLVVGASNYENDIVQHFEGAIDELRVWHRALDAQEVQFFYEHSFRKTGDYAWSFVVNNSVQGLYYGEHTYDVFVNNTHGKHAIQQRSVVLSASGTAPSNPGGSSGGSSSSWNTGYAAQTYHAPNPNVQTGYSNDLRINDRIVFEATHTSNLAVVNHTLQLNSFNATHARVTITSEPQTIWLALGQETPVDVDGDGKYDVIVRYDGSAGGQAKIHVRHFMVDEPAPVAPQVPMVQAPVAVDDEPVYVPVEEPRRSMWLWVVLIVIVVAGAAYFYKK